MGHLDRYKKTGGFLQLLELIESFAATKQQKFLTLIEEENPIWAKALRDKMLTVDRIVSWPSATLAEICPHMNLSLFAIALHGLKPEQMNHFLSGLPAGEKRKIQSEFDVVKPQPQDISTTHHKLIEAVRRLINEGQLRLETIDANVVINEKVEEQLLRSANFVRGETDEQEDNGQVGQDSGELVKEAVRGTDPAAKTASGEVGRSSDLKSLQILVVNLQKENKVLKSEVKVLKDKLETIRKIA